MVAPVGSEEDPVTAITTKFVKTVYNKQRCPIFCTSVSCLFLCVHACVHACVLYMMTCVYVQCTYNNMYVNTV